MCPKCKVEHKEDVSTCDFCGAQLVELSEEVKKDENDRRVNNLNWLMEFGNITAKKAITILFYLGSIPLIISSIMIGRYIYLTNEYHKGITYIENGTRWYTEARVNNLPLGVLSGIVYFVVGIFTWKIICELLMIIFRCFETYLQKNKI